MEFLLKYILFIFPVLLLIGQSQAIVIKEGDCFDLEKSKKWAQKFSNVCEVIVSHKDGGQYGTGVLISPTSVLTAAHVVRAGETLNKKPIVNFAAHGIGFKTNDPFRFVDDIIVHPEVNMSKQYICEGVDLAILKFQQPIENITSVKLYESKVKENFQGYIVGYGGNGVHNKGVIEKNHTRGMGTTRITGYEGIYMTYDFQPSHMPQPGIAPDTFTPTDKMDNYQSIAVPNDSGGPLLFGTAPDSLSVAGIYHGMDLYVNEDGPSLMARSKWIALQPHLEWIKANIQ